MLVMDENWLIYRMDENREEKTWLIKDMLLMMYKKIL
jgi:hypothetical protein